MVLGSKGSWCFQPIWKICSSQIESISLSPICRVKINHILEASPSWLVFVGKGQNSWALKNMCVQSLLKSETSQHFTHPIGSTPPPDPRMQSSPVITRMTNFLATRNPKLTLHFPLASSVGGRSNTSTNLFISLHPGAENTANGSTMATATSAQ